jgi:archaellin
MNVSRDKFSIYFENKNPRNFASDYGFSSEFSNKIDFLKKRSSKRKKVQKSRGSQGITAGILLISVILSAAGLSFVILTLGADSAQRTEVIGSKANEYSSSAFKLIGDLVTGFDTDDDTSIEGIVFSLRMILESGSIDLNEDFVELTIIVANSNEVILNYNSTLDDIDELGANPNNQYGIKYYNADGDNILEKNEMAMFLIKVGTDISQCEKFTIIFSTSSALFKIEKYIPTSVSNGSNILL